MEAQDFLLVAACTLGFISICRASLLFVKWVWAMFLRPPKNLKQYGSWVIITGSTDGIGKAIAMEMASKGLNLVLVGRNPLKLEVTLKEITDKHGEKVEVKLVVLDLEKASGVEIVKKIEEATEGLDVGILVNNAGLAYPYARFFHEVDTKLMDEIIKVNVEGASWVAKAVLPAMIKKKKGAIVNIGSGSTVVIPSYPLYTVYAATKSYLAMFSRCISLEYERQGIDVQCQFPLFVETKMTKLRASMFVPSPEMYGKACMRWIGYDSMCVPYCLHSIQCLLLKAIPDALLNWYILRSFLSVRKRGLLKDSKVKASASSKAN
ncbi:hypothetical protein L6164_000106 [Bauhinia variegata]|uniref:Uncharacterized protein n=1 Tax=Bauhinia variegata TaxID=167791 RepID=A0ACB9Q4P8_BAUVA|nr:hypothetical protein L6164_000106 [Bauhinia variegata]